MKDFLYNIWLYALCYVFKKHRCQPFFIGTDSPEVITTCKCGKRRYFHVLAVENSSLIVKLGYYIEHNKTYYFDGENFVKAK